MTTVRRLAALCALMACARTTPAPGPGGATADASANTAPTPPPALPRAPLPGTPVELGGRSRQGKYVVALRFSVPSVSEMFSAEVRVGLASGAAPPDGTTVTVDATMPEHRHGMMTQPATTGAGPGQWRTAGLKLHMQGHWVFAVAVQGPAGDDRLELPFEQPPEATAP